VRAAVLYGPRDLRIEDRPTPSPGPDEALVRVRAVGVCGSDVHYYAHGRMGSHVVEAPLVLGHECAGEVEAVGERVEALGPGMRVVIEPGVPCGECDACGRGLYNVCPRVRFMGTPPVDGAFCEYVAWPARFVYPMPEGVSDEAGAMVEPFAVGVHAVRVANLNAGETAAIIGSAAVGLSTLQAAKCAGAGKCMVIDLVPERLAVARALGADAAIHAGDEDAVARVMEETGGLGADVVFEAAGVPPAVRQALALVRAGGRILLIGICHDDVFPFDFGNLRRKEASLHPVRRYRDVFPECLRLVGQAKADLDALVTHRFPFDRIQEALELAREGAPGLVKAVVTSP